MKLAAACTFKTTEVQYVDQSFAEPASRDDCKPSGTLVDLLVPRPKLAQCISAIVGPGFMLNGEHLLYEFIAAFSHSSLKSCITAPVLTQPCTLKSYTISIVITCIALCLGRPCFDMTVDKGPDPPTREAFKSSRKAFPHRLTSPNDENMAYTNVLPCQQWCRFTIEH